ncbi:unnamed protein product [marine sediment metagenome]|uniref:Uncharacterized protein n=1 Tax=marine sediment metagenome TaxID=412755 RepID=X1AHP9_9ZZZZ
MFTVSKQEMKQARKLIKKNNFMSARKLSRLLNVTGSRAGMILVIMKEWRRYTPQQWAREGYPI